MSAQELDVRRSWATIRRYRWVVLAVAAVGLAGGLLCGLFVVPAMPTGKALVVLPPPAVDDNGNSTQDIETQVLIANSAPVLTSAARSVRPPLSVKEVKDRVQVVAVTQEILEIRARGTSDQQAMDLANAVAETYVYYVTDSSARLPADLGEKVGARVLERATTTSGGNLAVHLLLFGGTGAVAMAVLGALAVLIAARGDRRLQWRDDIADAVGIPVLASFASRRPRKLSAWTELFEGYRPSSVDAWSIRKMLRHLGQGNAGDQVTVSVVSLAEDVGALAVGPQLAVFASSVGVATELVVDARHESVAPLVAAEPDLSQPPGDLRRRVAADDPAEPDAEVGQVGLRVFVVVVDRNLPTLAGTEPAASTVVAVSAGQVTADELARVAVAAADVDREIEGIVVADPDSADRTTGSGPRRLSRPASHRPTTLTQARRMRR